MNTTAITIYFTINGEGEYEVGADLDESQTRFSENIGGTPSLTYCVEIEDVKLPDEEPQVIRISMKRGKVDEAPAHMGECGFIPGK